MALSACCSSCRCCWASGAWETENSGGVAKGSGCCREVLCELKGSWDRVGVLAVVADTGFSYRAMVLSPWQKLARGMYRYHGTQIQEHVELDICIMVRPLKFPLLHIISISQCIYSAPISTHLPPPSRRVRVWKGLPTVSSGRPSDACLSSLLRPPGPPSLVPHITGRQRRRRRRVQRRRRRRRRSRRRR